MSKSYIETICKTIYQYDINGFFVNEYKSCAEASRETKICYSSIKSAKKGSWPTGGFYWLDYKIDKINLSSPAPKSIAFEIAVPAFVTVTE